MTIKMAKCTNCSWIRVEFTEWFLLSSAIAIASLKKIRWSQWSYSFLCQLTTCHVSCTTPGISPPAGPSHQNLVKSLVFLGSITPKVWVPSCIFLESWKSVFSRLLVHYPAKMSYCDLNEVIAGIDLGISEAFCDDIIQIPFKPPPGLNWDRIRHNIKCFQKSHPKYRRSAEELRILMWYFFKRNLKKKKLNYDFDKSCHFV